MFLVRPTERCAPTGNSLLAFKKGARYSPVTWVLGLVDAVRLGLEDSR
jgi:hypothetical protein